MLKNHLILIHTNILWTNNNVSEYCRGHTLYNTKRVHAHFGCGFGRETQYTDKAMTHFTIFTSESVVILMFTCNTVSIHKTHVHTFIATTELGVVAICNAHNSCRKISERVIIITILLFS